MSLLNPLQLPAHGADCCPLLGTPFLHLPRVDRHLQVNSVPLSKHLWLWMGSACCECRVGCSLFLIGLNTVPSSSGWLNTSSPHTSLPHILGIGRRQQITPVQNLQAG